MTSFIKVYIAAPSEEHCLAKILASELEVNKIVVTSRWLNYQTLENLGSVTAGKMCLNDILHCDIFLLLNLERWRNNGTGGRHVEFGFALAHKKPIIIYGERTNTFHHFVREVTRIEPTDDYVKAIKDLYDLRCTL